LEGSIVRIGQTCIPYRGENRMREKNLLYRGPAQVYLQGQDALFPIHAEHRNYIEYVVGSPEGMIRLADLRPPSVAAARHLMAGRNGIELAAFFNRPAWVEARELGNGVSIELYEAETDERQPFAETPVLWLGVLEDGRMPSYRIAWEALDALEAPRLAFAALVLETEPMVDVSYYYAQSAARDVMSECG
jgi:hypothetical protein